MMFRRLLSLFFAFIVLISVATSAFAESKDTQHDRDIEQVLFGPKGVSNNQEALILLQWAAYFTLDCIGKENLEEQHYLDKLRSYGITVIPAKVADFHYQNNRFENQHHERCTHKGWGDNMYGKRSEDIGNWVTVRKPMLISAFTRVLVTGQKEWWESVDVLKLFSPKVDPTVGKQCESLAAIVYYTHILGDHCYNTRTTLPDRIPIVRNHISESNPDLLNELKIHLAILFQTQTSSEQYSSLIDGIDKIRDQWMVNVGTYDVANDEQYTAYQREGMKLMTVLKTKIYQLLKEEVFFTSAFYQTSNY